jgi:hypothetical protein
MPRAISILPMFLRMRWLAIGAALSVGVMAYLAAQVKRARERLSARTLARSGGRAVASLLDRAANRLTPSQVGPG